MPILWRSPLGKESNPRIFAANVDRDKRGQTGTIKKTEIMRSRPSLFSHWLPCLRLFKVFADWPLPSGGKRSRAVIGRSVRLRGVFVKTFSSPQGAVRHVLFTVRSQYESAVRLHGTGESPPFWIRLEIISDSVEQRRRATTGTTFALAAVWQRRATAIPWKGN